jgi:hypothetical protein
MRRGGVQGDFGFRLRMQGTNLGRGKLASPLRSDWKVTKDTIRP